MSRLFHGQGPSEEPQSSRPQASAPDLAHFRAHIERVRDATDIIEVIQTYLELDSSHRGPCPFHEDARRAFRVNRQGQHYHCDSCGAGGDIFRSIELIKKVSFAGAIKILADRTGIPPYPLPADQAAPLAREREMHLILMDAAHYYHNRLTGEAKDYLTGKLGLPEAVLDRFLVGQANRSLRDHLLGERKWPLELCLETGILVKDESEAVTDTFANVVIFPVLRRGVVTDIMGMNIHEEPSKVKQLPGENGRLYSEDDLRCDEIYLVEHPLDVLSLKAWDLPAAALIGSGSEGPEVVDRLRVARRVYICFPGGTNGEKRAMKVGHAIGPRARIVRLPKGRSPNDLYREGSREDFHNLVAQAKDPITTEIESIPMDTPKTELVSYLEPVLRLLVGYDLPAAEAYLTTTIKNCFKLNAADVETYRRLLDRYRREAAQRGRNENLPAQHEVLWKDLALICPAQDFVEGVAYFSVYRTCVIQEKNGVKRAVREPFLVTSERKVIPLTPNELAKLGLRLAKEDLLPSDSRRWATDDRVPNSVHAFIHGNAQVDPGGLFDEIEGLFRTYGDYANDDCYAVLTLWCIGTYTFMIFEAYPYISLRSPPHSGKTRTIEIAAPLCFNSLVGASLTEASIYRAVERDRCTVFLDEAEKYRARNRASTSDLFAIFNSGYKRSGSVSRYDTRSRSTVNFSTFSPKMLANITGLDPAAEDRTIPIEPRRTGKELPRFDSQALAPKFAELRNSLQVFAPTHHAEIARRYRSRERVEGLRDREEELWSPILALADFFDEQRFVRNGALAEEDRLVPKILRFAAHCRSLKEKREVEGSIETQVLAGVLRFVQSTEPLILQDGTKTILYLSDDFLTYLRESEGLDTLTKTKLTQVLKRLRIVQNPNKDTYWHRWECRGKRMGQMYYRLCPGRIRVAVSIHWPRHNSRGKGGGSAP
ncbi:MAG: CHC2 zinc finger domain-containing protein [Planctomycetota bacterium]|nr:CHC2 zinc finger domain-containing protein [Planctomycetota bacterium]